MKFHNAGKYNGDESSLPQRKHPSNYVPFKEFEDMHQLTTVMSIGAIVTILICAIPIIFLGRTYILDQLFLISIACISTMLVIVPHECLHALCFRKDVYMYNNISQGMFFVTGVEDMRKARFIFMCLLPNFVFGLLPYIIFLSHPHLVFVGVFGAVNLASGFGDYINAYHAIKQVPNKAMIYMSGMHSYWYLPIN